MGIAARLLWVVALLVCATLVAFVHGNRRKEPFVDFSSRWKAAQCAVEENVALRESTGGGTDMFQRKWDALLASAGTNTCPEDISDADGGITATTRDGPVDKSKSLAFLDHHYMDCKSRAGVRGLKFMPSDNALAVSWTCDDSAKTNSHRTKRTQWARVAQGMIPHDANCGVNPISGYGFESDGDDMIRLRYDCATGIETQAPMRYYNGWKASVDTIARTDAIDAQCPSGTVLTRMQFRNCDATADDTVTFTCAKPTGTVAGTDVPDAVSQPMSVAAPEVDLTLKQELDIAFADTRRYFSNAGTSMRGVIVEAGKGSWRVMKNVGGIFTGFGKGTVDGFNAFTGRLKKSGNRFVKGASFSQFRESFQDMRLIGAAFPRAAMQVGAGMKQGWNEAKGNFSVIDKAINNVEASAQSVGTSFTTSFRAIRDSFPKGWGAFVNEVDDVKTQCFEKKWKDVFGV